MSKSDAEYRGEMDCVMEDLSLTLVAIGALADDDTSHTDAQLVELTCKKLTMLHDIAKETLAEGILKAVMKG